MNFRVEEEMRITRLSYTLVTALSLAATVSCGKKKSSDDSSDEEAATATGLALSDASPAESFELVSTAVQSFDEAIEAAAGSLAIEEAGLLGEEEKANF